MLIDSHCHLQDRKFDKDRDAVIERGRDAGITAFVTIGYDMPSSRRGVDLADSNPDIHAAIGVHPHDAKTVTPKDIDDLDRLADSAGVVAIGEIGLDYYRDRSPRDDQRRAFADQLDLAGELGLPAVIHNRDAGDDLLQQALPWGAARDNPGVLHAFSSDQATAAAAAQAGFFLGVAGPITFPNAEGRRIITGALPPERVVLETDAPYLSPHPRRGERNEPARVALIAEALSAVWRRRPDETRRMTWDNAETLFHWNDGTDHDHLL